MIWGNSGRNFIEVSKIRDKFKTKRNLLSIEEKIQSENRTLKDTYIE